MHDQLLRFIRENSGHVTSRDLAERFLKFKSPDPGLAHRAVSAILAADKRCRLADDGMWHAESPAGAADGARLADIPWAAVHVLTDPKSAGHDLVHLSIWTVFPGPECLLDGWAKDPALLGDDDRAVFPGEAWDTDLRCDRADLLARAATLLDTRLAVFLQRSQHGILSRHCSLAGETLTDEALGVGQLMGLCDAPAPRPMTLEKCCEALLGAGPRVSRARDAGRALAECAVEAIARLTRAGIETREALFEADNRQVERVDLTGKAFTHDDLLALPTAAGVYAFKDSSGSFVYIGKSKNLRNRVTGYFRPTDESPEKLDSLRIQAHALTVHPCGSELEALVYEYRLIRKHKPALNTQRGINERPGSFTPLADSIVLLPHADPDKGMSFWFRRNQKIMLKPFFADFRPQPELVADLETFFFSDKLPPAPDDFPEQEIVFRWVKRHLPDLVVVPVHGVASAREAWEAVRGYWSEVRRPAAAGSRAR